MLPDLLDDPDSLVRATGMVDPGALAHAHQAIRRVQEAKEALRQAYCDRDDAVRAAVAANPDLPVAAGA